MGGKKTVKAEKTAKPAEAHGSRKAAVGLILNKLEEQLLGAGVAKGTVADYLRLLQLMKEMGDERPREIEITWVNSLRGERGR